MLIQKSLKSLDNLFESSSIIINNVTSDNVILKAASDLSFKPSNFQPGLIARPE